MIDRPPSEVEVAGESRGLAIVSGNTWEFTRTSVHDAERTLAALSARSVLPYATMARDGDPLVAGNTIAFPFAPLAMSAFGAMLTYRRPTLAASGTLIRK